MEKSEAHYKKMSETPVEKLIFSLSLPTIVSMLITNIYNIADTYFVSRIGTSASGAVGIVFALMAILQAIGFMHGHGSGGLISIMLGEKDVTASKRLASTAFFSAIGFGIVIAVLGLIFLNPLMYLLGSTSTILPYAKSYAVSILIAAPVVISGFVMNNILRYEGKAAFAMIGLTAGGILNIALDPIFIFYLKMGIAGAGLATALSQCVSWGILLSMFLRGKTQTSFDIRCVTHSLREYMKILRVGTPSLLRQGLSCISTMLLNNAASMGGDAAVAGMSIVGRVSFFIYAVGIGIGQGLQPVSGFNYGAKLYLRVRKAYKFTICYGTICYVVLSAIIFTFAVPIITAFRDDPEVIAVGVPALRLQCIPIIFSMPYFTTNMIYQSIGKSGGASFLASLKNGICFIPLILILPHCMGMWGVICAQPLADTIAVTATLPFIVHFLKTLPKETNCLK